MFARRFVGPCLTAALVASFMASARGQAPDPWPPAGVHLWTEPGLTRPTPVQTVKPRYTPAAMRARVEGSVRLAAVVEADGSVKSVRVMRSLNQELDAQAIETAKQWRFTPATLNGTAVPVLITLELSYQLRPPPPPATVLAWPEAFPSAPPTIANDSWTVDAEQADNLEYRIATPSDWRRFPDDAALTARVSADRRIILTVGRPRSFPTAIDHPLSPEQLAALGQVVSRPRASGVSTSLAATGQVRTPNGFWIWLEMPMAPEAALPTGALGDAPRTYDGFTLWQFATTVGGRLLQVGCGVARTHGESDAEFAKTRRDAGAVCERIIDRMTITAQ